MGKSTISTGPFSIAMLNHQRVYKVIISSVLDHSPSKHFKKTSAEDMMLTAAAEEFDNLDADEAKSQLVSPWKFGGFCLTMFNIAQLTS